MIGILKNKVSELMAGKIQLFTLMYLLALKLGEIAFFRKRAGTVKLTSTGRIKKP